MYTPLRFSLFFPLYNVMHTYSPVVYMLPSVYVGSTNELISAFIAGGTAAMVSHPFHVLKVRQMASETKV